MKSNQYYQKQLQGMTSQNPVKPGQVTKAQYAQYVQNQPGMIIPSKPKGNATHKSGMLSNGQIQVVVDGKYSLSDQKNYKSFSNGGTAIVPQSLSSHQAKMNNLNEGQLQNQYVYKNNNKQKQSKTTSANSPIATSHQLMVNTQAAHDNYVGTSINSPPASGLSSQNPQQIPQTIQIKTGKMIYNTANQSPVQSQQKLQKLIEKDQNLNLIQQLQKNQLSMLYRISQQQVQDVHNENGYQEELNNNDEYTDQGSRGDNTVSTIQHLPNMNGHASMSSKQKAQVTQINQGVRSRMSLKQTPSGGVVTVGTQGTIKTSQKGASATDKQKSSGTYNQKRLQQNSLSNNLKSQGSQVMPPPIQQQQAILTQSNRLGSQEFLRKKSGKKNTQQQTQKRTQYINHQSQPQEPVVSSYIQSYQIAQNQQLPSQSSAQLSNYYTAESQQMQNASAPPQSSLIQAPHFIKVKSKTNANPTRHNSPRNGQQRYPGKFSASNGFNPMRESQPAEQAFSMPNSPAKEEAQETMISMGTSQSIINKSNKAKNQSVSNNILRNSIDNKMRQQSKGGQSTKDVYNQVNGTNPRINSGIPSQGQVQGQSFQNNKRRLNSPQIGEPMAYLTQNGQIAYKTQGSSQMEQQEKKYLNMAVSKNIGGIASGNARRENRNQMMKNHQQQQSVVGSMGSMGSLGPFMGVQESSGTEGTEGYHTMKQMAQGDQNNQTHFSQLQQMHLNNVNPMFFATGGAIHNQNQKSLLIAGGTMTNMSNQQHQTMGGPIQHISSPVHNQSQQSKNSTVGSQGQPIHQKKFSISGQQQFENPNYYEQQNLSSQAKTNIIQMRKVAPQSKTAVVGSKNPSIERSLIQIQQQNQTQGQRLNQGHKYQQNGGMNQTTKNFAQTTKPSYNNSPVNRQKTGALIVGGYQQNNVANKRPQQAKQQPIGQPMGDNSTGLAHQDLEFINNQSNTFYTNNSSQIKSHHLAQSVLLSDQVANQMVGKQNAVKQFSNSIIRAPQTSQTALNEKNNHLIGGGKLKLKVMSETASPNGFIHQTESGENSKMSRDDQGVRKSSSKGGLKSKNANGRTKNASGTNTEIGQQYFQQYFQQKKHSNYIQINDKYHPGYGKFAQVDSPKDGSIERVRQDDMMLQEKQITSMNKQLMNVISLEEQPWKSQTQSNANQQYIIKQLDTKDVSKLSPRSKEVFLIKKLITDCFKKYNKPPKTQLELYKIGKMLGKGAFGKVNLGLHRLTRKLVAIKSINMDFLKEESQKKKIMNEINILKSLRHPNNIKILETFQTDKHHMIVMELCPGGDLLNYVRKRRKLTEKYAQFVFKQIMEGIAYLHDNNVAHRDIKLDNILLDGHGNIKLGDFGVSRKIEENEILFEQCGTPAYIAPEIVKDMGYKGFPVDIWSAGICLYAMLYGNVPFKANQIGDLNTVEQLNQDIEYKDTVSKEAIALMKTMLQKVPKQRSTAQDVLEDKWLNMDDGSEHIDIFDEQELELIRKEFTYVVQKKKLKDFKEQKQKLDEADVSCHQASRRADDLNTEFTECSIQTHENSLLKNDSSRSVILCPFNTQTGDKTADKIIALTVGMMEDKDHMIRFHPRVRELDRNFEKLNNQDFDNGVYHKYAYKQKINLNKKDEENLKEEQIMQSDVQMNNLVADPKQAETARKRRREKADINYHNYYIKINENIIKDTEKLGFPIQYIQKCIKENANNHCTTTYYLLCMDQNF